MSLFQIDMKELENQPGVKYMYPTADAGCESEENYTYLENNGQILCLAYNIQKLHNKTVANRQGQFLYEIKVA